MEYLAQRLQQLRRQKGLSQENLAEQLGVSRQAVGKWESGAAVPELEKLLELCRLFDTDLNDLLGLESRSEQESATQDPRQEGSQQAQGFTEEQMELLRQLIRESRQTPPAAPMRKKKWPWVVAAVVIGLFFLGNWYESLENRLWNLQNQASNTQNQISGLHSSIGNIENNIKETLEQQASILTFSGAEMGQVTFAPRQFTCSLWALPKNRTEQTRVRFSLETDTGTKVFDAAWTGDRYMVQPTMDWCRIITVTVVVEESGVLSSEVLKDIWLDPADEVLLLINGWAAIDTWGTKPELWVNAGVYIQQPDQSDSTPTSVQMWLEQDGTALASIPLHLTYQELEPELWDYDTQGLAEFTLPKRDQTLTLHARVTDSLGCIYEMTAAKVSLQWRDGSLIKTQEALSESFLMTVTLPDGSKIQQDGNWKY